jgi:hypothetical protein
MSSSFRVRLRLPSSKQETLSLPTPVTIRALLERIQPFVEVDLTQIGLRLAYPPKAFDLGSPSEWDRNVKDIGINNGEGLVVIITEERPSTTTQPTPPSQPNVAEPVSVQPTKPKSSNLKVSFNNIEHPVTLAKSSSPSKRDRGPSVLEEPPEIPLDGGTIVLRIMEDDNSCMYIS